MKLINDEILSKCIVEFENTCVPHADDLLKRVQDVLETLTVDGQQMGATMRCKVCGRGSYRLQFPKKKTYRMLPVPPLPDPQFSANAATVVDTGNFLTVHVYSCGNCGNIALFQFPDRTSLPAWNGVKSDAST